MSQTVISFCDLDDVLFFSERKCPQGVALKPVVIRSSSGKGYCFQTPAQQALFAMLRRSTRLIPTTGRTSSWLARVQLDFADYKVCSFGGVILAPDSTPVESWRQVMEAASLACQEEMEQLRQAALVESSRRAFDVRVKVQSDFGTRLYLSVKHNRRESSEMAELASVLSGQMPAGWQMHANGRNIALLPPFLGKRKAVNFILEHTTGGDALVFALGDSFSDLEFMSAADFALFPAGSQIAGSPALVSAD